MFSANRNKSFFFKTQLLHKNMRTVLKQLTLVNEIEIENVKENVYVPYV